MKVDRKYLCFSYRCQALLFYKLFKMRKNDSREIQKTISEYCSKVSQIIYLFTNRIFKYYKHLFQNAAIPMDQPCPAGQGTPSPLSPTPSPAGSVGSVGSQSSGYSSGELRGAGAAPPGPAGPAGGTWIPLSVYSAMVKQNQHFTYLISYQDLWELADQMVIKGKFTGKF